MTVEPGYYWIRWPDAVGVDDEWKRDWNPARLNYQEGELVAWFPDESGYSSWSTRGAELGPRIEPPRDVA